MLKSRFVLRQAFCLLALLTLSAGGRCLHAQSTTDGAISATVTDASGAAVSGANVAIRNNGTSLEQTAVTDDTGYLRVVRLQPTSYTVKVESAGMATLGAFPRLRTKRFDLLRHQRLAGADQYSRRVWKLHIRRAQPVCRQRRG